MHLMDLVVAFSALRFSFCSFCDSTESLKIVLFIDKETHFYLLLPSSLQYILTYIFTCLLAIQV